MPIKRIVVTGDILRFNRYGEYSQAVNISWLYNLVQPAFAGLTDLEVVEFGPKSGASGLVGNLYSSYFLQQNVDAWAAIYEKVPSARDLGLIQGWYEDALVVAFELPDILAASLTKLEIPFVDFTLHPVRFLEDLIFGVRSNISRFGRLVAASSVGDHYFSTGTSFARAKLSRMASLEGFVTGRRVVLFADQTSDDRVLIDNGRFLKIEDFIDKIRAIALRADVLLLKPHPLSTDLARLEILKDAVPNAVWTHDNIYRLIVQEGVESVVSLCSSASIEAPLFGVRGQHLARYPYVFDRETDSVEGFHIIHPDFWQPEFWAPILAVVGGAKRAQLTCRAPSRVPERFRSSLGMSWGASILRETQC